ncbi:MAG: 2-hydroxyacid dehydrogenase [Parahaliea sp.]
MNTKIFVTHQLPGERIHDLPQLCDLNVWMGPGLLPHESLREELSACEGVICLLTDCLDASLLDAMPELKFISTMSVGVDHIDVSAATERGIAVGHTPGVLVNTTADANFALLLAAARRVAEADRYVRQGNWRPESAWTPDFFAGKDVSGATLGIIGLGEIGQAVARRAQGFGMNVLSWTRSGREVAGVEAVSLEALLLRSDFVSVNTALTPQTRNLLNAERIATMKPGAVLVNTARGGVVDEKALAEALQCGDLLAAGIDVFESEPLAQDSPLLHLPNVILTPHIASSTTVTRARMADIAVENAIAALKGQHMPHCANPQVYADR